MTTDRDFDSTAYGRGYKDGKRDAATEITRLKAEVRVRQTIVEEARDERDAALAENERLRAALEMFACDCAVHERCVVPDNCRNFQARRALNKEPRK
jgi:hypothetical protein